MDDKSLLLNGIIGLFPANSVGDDIEVYTDDTRNDVQCKLLGLRQQAERDGAKAYFCLSDFIAPKASGVADYIGMFVNTSGIGMDELVKKYKCANDDYGYIMAEALADRLAEAFAEKLHELVRKEYWGYVPKEHLTCDELRRVKYQVRYSQSWAVYSHEDVC